MTAMIVVIISFLFMVPNSLAGIDWPQSDDLMYNSKSHNNLRHIPKIIWSDVEEKDLLTDEEHKVAFRDIYIEQMVKRFFNVWLTTSKAVNGHNRFRFPRILLLKDPTIIGSHIEYSGSKAGVYDVTFEAYDCKMHGLHDMKLKRIDVLRHMGLNDFRVIIQLDTTLTLTGKYHLNGTGLSMIPLTGAGHVTIVVKDLTLTIETYGLYRKYDHKKDELFMRDLSIKVKDKKLDVNMENLMGGSAIGDVANNVMDVIGEAMLYQHKDQLTKYVRKLYRAGVSMIFEFSG